MVKVVVEELTDAHAWLTSDSLQDAAVTCARDRSGQTIVNSVARSSFFMVSSAFQRISRASFSGWASGERQFLRWNRYGSGITQPNALKAALPKWRSWVEFRQLPLVPLIYRYLALGGKVCPLYGRTFLVQVPGNPWETKGHSGERWSCRPKPAWLVMFMNRLIRAVTAQNRSE